MSKNFALSLITFKEGVRNKTLYAVCFFSVVVFFVTFLSVGFFMRDLGKVAIDINLSAISFTGLMLIMFVGINLMAKDIEKKTIHVVFSKPFSRSDYIFSKYLALVLICSFFMFIVFFVSLMNIYLIKFIYSSYFHEFNLMNYCLATFFLMFKISIVCSFVVLFSTVSSSSFLTFIYSFSFYVASVSIDDVVFYLKSKSLMDEMIFAVPIQKVINISSYFIPNLSVFDLKINAAHSLTISHNDLIIPTLYGLFYIVIALIIASVIFSRKEFT